MRIHTPYRAERRRTTAHQLDSGVYSDDFDARGGAEPSARHAPSMARSMGMGMIVRDDDGMLAGFSGPPSVLHPRHRGYGQILTDITGAISAAGQAVSSGVQTAEGAAASGVNAANSVTGSAQSTLNTVTGAGATPAASGSSSSLLPVGAGIVGLFLIWKLVL